METHTQEVAAGIIFAAIIVIAFGLWYYKKGKRKDVERKID